MSEKKDCEEYPSEEAPSQAESFEANRSGTSETYDMRDFCPGIRIEAKDFDGKWYPAKVSDVDWTENEILVHFENWNTKFDEWIPMDSSRLRPIQKPVSQQKDVPKFSKGEEVMAVWSANQKYPGVIQAVLPNDRYDVLFCDGFLKRLKAHKITKLQEGIIRPEVKNFTDIGTKEERRERKRKINVAELFHINKRSKKKGLVHSKSQDIKTYPGKSKNKGSVIKKLVPEESKEEATNFSKESKPEDKVLPSSSSVSSKSPVDSVPAAFEVKYLNGQTETWSKQLYQRSEGRTAGKLDIVILNPQGRKFRSRNEIMKYCEENGIIYSHEAFDFSARGRPKSKSLPPKTEPPVEDKEKPLKKGGKKLQNDLVVGSQPLLLPIPEPMLQENVTQNKVFIGDFEVVIENGKFICPVKVCGKHFRRENLLHMHMKHYHPEFSKYLDYTPSVTDLAYARTVGNLDAVETPPPGLRKLPVPEKLEKSTVKTETVRRASDVSSETTKDIKRIKTSEVKIEGRNHSVKPSSDVSMTSLTSAEEPADDQKNKFGSVGLQLPRSINQNEGDGNVRESTGNVPEGNTGEQSQREVDTLSGTPRVVIKPPKSHRIHCRKKSNRYQGSFSGHIRKKKFMSQDRARSHSRIGRQPQSHLRQQLQQIPSSQTTFSPDPCIEVTMSSGTSQSHLMTRYPKPHLNVTNEISGKSSLGPRYKTPDPEKDGQESRKKVDRRSFLEGLLKRKEGRFRRRHWRKKKPEWRSGQSLEKPDTAWETDCGVSNIGEVCSESEGNHENAENSPPNVEDRGSEKRRKQSLRNTKKVRFEKSVCRTCEGEALAEPSSREAVRREEQSQLGDTFSRLIQLDDSCTDKKSSVITLDQTDVTEDSKSPTAMENDKIEKLRRNEIINCICGITEEDGLMIQCDICLCWQHGHCAGILREVDVPEKYICAICKNPFRGRSSLKYLHDQEWLKEGTLPSLSFRSKREDLIEQRKAILKRSHDLSGSITLLAQVIHSLRIKVNIAEKKDHPKLWLWAKKWTEKKPNRIKEECEVKEERAEETNADGNMEVKTERDQDETHLPKAPEPEAPIDSAECRLNLLDHLIHYQTLIDARLSCIESLVAELESMQDDAVNDETPDSYPTTKATVQMILRDLNTMEKIATI